MKTSRTEKESATIDQIELQVEQTLLLILSSALEKVKAKLTEERSKDDIGF
jgi:hypothetical protein